MKSFKFKGPAFALQKVAQLHEILPLSLPKNDVMIALHSDLVFNSDVYMKCHIDRGIPLQGTVLYANVSILL